MNAAGIEGDLVYFLIEDHQVTDNSFYSLIDSLVASGEVFKKKKTCFILVVGIVFLNIRFQAHTTLKKWKLF